MMEEIAATTNNNTVDAAVNGVNGNGNSEEIVCRDYLRNVCSRGTRCRYLHPNGEEARNVSNVVQQAGGLTFCHDFQNTQCNRASCKFVHGTRQDEEHYKNTGELPRSVLKPNEGEPPVCKDFQKGDCHRGKKCKFRHISTDSTKTDYRERFEREEYEPPEAKRRHVEDSELQARFSYRHYEYSPYYRERQNYSPPNTQWSFSQSSGANGGNSGSQLEMRMLHEENLILRRKIEDLKKQVLDLMATNEFLLEQNAHLRLGKLPTATSVAAVTIPAVTIASSMTVSAPTSVSAIGQLASVQTGTAALPLGATAQVTPTLSASLPIAGTMSLAQPTQLATVSIAPVSLAQPALAAPAGTVTLAPTLNAAGIHLAPNTALSLSAASAGSLVSYPIMTQSLVASAALQNSLTH